MKKITVFIIALTIFISAHSISRAQNTDSRAQNTDWMRIQSDNGEFSIEIPKNYTYFYDKDGFEYRGSDENDYQFASMQMVNASSNKTIMRIEVYETWNSKTQLDLLAEKERYKTKPILTEKKDFYIKQSEVSNIKETISHKDTEVNFITRFIASKTHVYIISVASRGQKTAESMRFMDSIRLEKNQSGYVKLSTNKPLKIGDVGVDETKLNNSSQTQDNQNSNSEKVDIPVPLLILSKPFASYTNPARKSRTTGKIRLKVTFDENGRISKIVILSGLPDGLIRNAFFAALRIKFLPEEKDNKPNMVTKRIDYSFEIG